MSMNGHLSYSDDAKIAHHARAVIAPFVKPPYWGLLPVEGRTLQLVMQDSLAEPTAFQQVVARELYDGLNDHVHHDGRWGVYWTDWNLLRGDFQRLEILWFDKDGDLNFTVQCTEPIEFYMNVAGMASLISDCDDAHREYHALLKDMDVKEGRDTKKAALGEKMAHSAEGDELIFED